MYIKQRAKDKLITCLCYKVALFAIVLFIAGIPDIARAQDDSLATRAQDDSLATPIDTISGTTIGTHSDDTSIVQEKDLYDVIDGIFRKKNVHRVVTPEDTVITSKLLFSVMPAIGYTLVSKLAGVIAGNVAFRMDTTANVSTINCYISYTQNKQFLLPIRSNIWTKNNKFDLVGDLRFYKYPQSTFGLGSASKIVNEDPMDYLYLRFYETVLRHIAPNFLAGAGFIIDYHGDITHKGNLNGAPSDYTAYGEAHKTISSGFTANALYDSRDNSIYVTKGMYASLQLRQNLTALGSTSSWSSAVLDLRKYIRLPANTDNVLAIWSYNWWILDGHPGYLDLPSTQWDAYSCTGRGYIQGRFRGTREAYLETEYRFKITRNGLLGGVVFVNAQSFSAGQGTKFQAIQPGYGTGLRVKINKLSRTNIDIDYGFGLQGSRGVFVNIGEAF